MNEYQNSVKNDECKNNIYSKKYTTNSRQKKYSQLIPYMNQLCVYFYS
jgi:hypothetical protein